ncbi:AAA family ATPase [Candidatus Uhrbacteria bacterium]|nr:AAA family ATPase [Candidatus Uhrbacteria bacterium]
MDFQMTDILRSPNAIAKAYPDTDKKPAFPTEMNIWNGYTLVIEPAAKHITIIGPDGIPYGHFETFFSTKTKLDMRKVESCGYGRLLKRGARIYSSSDIRPEDYSEAVQNELRNIFLNVHLKSQELPDSITLAAKIDIIEKITHHEILSKIHQISDGKYIILLNGSSHHGYIAFRTKNERGDLLEPRNWIRYDLTNEFVEPLIPTEVLDFLEENDAQVSSINNYKPLNGSYSFRQDDEMINFAHNPIEGPIVFSDRVGGGKIDVFVDPNNSAIIYYYGPARDHLYRLDTSGDPAGWKSEPVPFSEQFVDVATQKLQADPTGCFFVYCDGSELVVLERQSLHEVRRIPGIRDIIFNENGNLHAIDTTGHLVVFSIDFSTAAREIEKRRTATLLQDLDIDKLFTNTADASAPPGIAKTDYGHLDEIRLEVDGKFSQRITGAQSADALLGIRKALDTFRDQLTNKKLSPDAIAYIVEPVDALLRSREEDLAAEKASTLFTLMRQQLDNGLSLTVISELKNMITELDSIDPLLKPELRTEASSLKALIDERIEIFFKKQGADVIRDVRDVVARETAQLAAFTSKRQMDEWMEYRFPQVKSRLGILAKNCPLASTDAYNALIQARSDLEGLAAQYELLFKQEYAGIRERATERIETEAHSLHHDIRAFLDRIQSKGFTTRAQAEQYIAASAEHALILEGIAALGTQDPERSTDIGRNLRISISQILLSIERGIIIADTGQQFVRFGDTVFPVWEAKTKKRGKRNIALSFDVNTSSLGVGTTADKAMGDVSLVITSADGKDRRVRLYEGMSTEDEWRFGTVSFYGANVEPSYVRRDDFVKIKKQYGDWSKGEGSTIRNELAEKRAKMRVLYSEREKAGGKNRPERDELGDAKWRTLYEAALKDYSEFYKTHHIALLRRIDRVRGQDDDGIENGKGYVPEMQNHWVADEQTENYLGLMAKNARMQLDLQEGLLNLKGHAGTGKDVLVKMFACRTGRPYFTVDCSKWTTEFELSEDIILEAKDGASQTIKVPSAVLTAIQTPGAILYFNEINAMPQSAQVFLHALMDEKRSITLKTSSGLVIRADKSVLLFGSMNPDYPETFKPQFATRSRMVSIDIDYPPLFRQPEPGDRNQLHPAYNASEPLRIARGVASLSNLTEESDLKRNEFVKLWDSEINGIDTDAKPPTPIQKFDILTTLALVQFAQKFRTEFTKIFEKGSDAHKALPATQPLTGRELRRCAYNLSHMPDDEKVLADPDETARKLLAEAYLCHIDNKSDREKLYTALTSWTSARRLAA